ncbi:MAG: hypothetical protein ACYDCI_02685 [Candidatus Limnocylindrales bacterium]
MGSQGVGLLYIVVMVAVVVVVDLRFLRHYTVRRLAVNVAIVAAFGAFYLAFLRH